MKKRGGRKPKKAPAKVKKKPKHGVKRKTGLKAKPKHTKGKQKTKARPKHQSRVKTKKAHRKKTKLPKLKLHKQVSAVAEEERLQKSIEKEVRYLLTPEEIPAVLFVCSLIILAFLFNSISIIFYVVVTLAVIWLSHFFHKHNHRPHDAIAISGIFFFPVVVTLIMYRDLLAWFLLFVYLLSALSTWIIYHYHKKLHRPFRIMWQVTYSKVVALTVGAIMVSLVPRLMPDIFMGITAMIFIYLLPIMIVVFFISKFLYIYYFEHRHIKHDIWISIRYAIIYAFVFCILVSASYSLLAVQMKAQHDDVTGHRIDTALLDSSRINKIFMKQPPELQNLQVNQEIITFNQKTMDEVADLKNQAMEKQLSFAGILDDSYFADMAQITYDLRKVQMKINSVIDAKDFVSTRYELLQETLDRNASLPGAKDMKEYAEKDKEEAEKRYFPNYNDQIIAEMLTKVDDPATTPSYFEDNGINWLFAEKNGVSLLYYSDNMFMIQFMKILRGTEVFRTMSATTFKTWHFSDKEKYSGHLEQDLYENRDAVESDMSKALRAELLIEKSTKRPPLMQLKKA